VRENAVENADEISERRPQRWLVMPAAQDDVISAAAAATTTAQFVTDSIAVTSYSTTEHAAMNDRPT